MLVPGLGVPAALVFGLLDEADGRVVGDAAEAALDQLPIRGGPMARDFRDGRGAVPFKPGALRFARGHAPRQHDLEGPLAQLDALRRNGVHRGALRQAHGGGAAFCRALHEAEGFVDLPIQLLLPGDELAPLAGGQVAGARQPRAQVPALGAAPTRQRGRRRLALQGRAGLDERGRKFRELSRWKWKPRELSRSELEEMLPLFCRYSSSDSSSTFIVKNLLHPKASR